MDAGFAGAYTCDLTEETSADVIVVLDGADVDLQRVMKCLKPRGVLYYEWSRLQKATIRVTPSHMRSSLERAGYTVHGIYAVSPTFKTAALYLPLDAPHALEWYVRSSYAGSGIKQRLYEGLLAGATGLRSDRFAHFAPLIAVVATSQSSEPAGPAVLQCPEITSLLGNTSDSAIVPILLSHGDDRVIVLTLPRLAGEPSLVIKVPRLDAFSGRNIQEQEVLSKVHTLVNSSQRGSIPHPLGVTEFGGTRASIENFIPGESMLRSTNRWGVPLRHKLADLEGATDWICRFHKQTTDDVVIWGRLAEAQFIEPLVSRFHQSFNITAQEQYLFTALCEQSNLLSDRRIPIVWQHRDFNLWNVLRKGQTVAVIDWEGGQRGLPLCDLLHFVTSWTAAVHRAGTLDERTRSFKRLFLEPDSSTDGASRAARSMIRQYCGRLGVDREFIPILLVYTWLELVLRRGDQLEDMAVKTAGCRKNNRYLDRLALLAEHADLIFGRDTFG